MEGKAGKVGVRTSSRWRGFILIGGVMALLVVLAVASISLLSPKGWSKDMVFDDGRMAMRVQFKVEPNPPTGRLTLMAKVKDVGGYPMRVDHVHFSLRKDGQILTGELEGEPVGDFSITSGEDSFHKAEVELLPAGPYQAVVAVQHRGSRFEAVWPFEVK